MRSWDDIVGCNEYPTCPGRARDRGQARGGSVRFWGMADPKPRFNRRAQDHQALALEWRRLTRAATFVALLTSPMVFVVLFYTHRWSFIAALLGTFVCVITFRGLIDVVAHRLIL